MTLDISSLLLPTFRENAMTHLHTLLAPQDLSLLSWLLSSKRKDPIKRVKENHANAHLKRLQESMMSFRKPV